MESSVQAPTTVDNLLLPVIPLREACLFPATSLALIVSRPAIVKAVEVALRTGGRALAVGYRDAGPGSPMPQDLYGLGAVAHVSDTQRLKDGTRRVELDGFERAGVVQLLGTDTLAAEVEIRPEGASGEEWGPAVEALARYLHAHPDLRSFLDQQRHSAEPMAWVNLACQHLPITPSARQKLLEANAEERCLKISRGLDALLRKEKTD